VTAGLTLSFAQATDMSVNMAMMPDAGVSSDGDCTERHGGAIDSGTPTACPPACTAAVFAVLSQEPAVMTDIQTSQLTSLPSPFLHGQDSLPDPSPPRPSGLL
jgi:hypothetical protein